jgi:NADPH:quinone reductase
MPAGRMRAVVVEAPGGPEVMRIRELPCPEPRPEQLLVRVRAAALNRADLLQRSGELVLPPGANPLMGVEIAGEVMACGAGVKGFVPGQRVFGLTEGGGYAECCVLDHEMATPVPEGWSFAQAAAVPEAFFTAHETLFELGGLRKGQTVLIHAGASGMGTVCIQLAHHAGARVLFIAGTQEKIQRCRELGGDAGILRGTGDFAREVLHLTAGEGVDLVEDFVGASALAANLSILKPGGCLLLVGVLDGMRGEIDLKDLILRRLQLKGTAMRSRPLADKRAITRRFRQHWLPELLAGRVRPVVDSVFPLERVADAHRRMEENAHFGKILLEP